MTCCQHSHAASCLPEARCDRASRNMFQGTMADKEPSSGHWARGMSPKRVSRIELGSALFFPKTESRMPMQVTVRPPTTLSWHGVPTLPRPPDKLKSQARHQLDHSRENGSGPYLWPVCGRSTMRHGSPSGCERPLSPRMADDAAR